MTKRGSRFVAIGLVLAIVVAMLVPMMGASAGAWGYVLGFKDLYTAIPDVVGTDTGPLTYNGITGDATQATANGTLMWQRATNWTAFCGMTDCWVVGPAGIVKRGINELLPFEPKPMDPMMLAALNGIPDPQLFGRAATWSQSGVALRGYIGAPGLVPTINHYYLDMMPKMGWTLMGTMALPPGVSPWGGTLQVFTMGPWVAAVTYGSMGNGTTFAILALAPQALLAGMAQ